MGFLEDLRKQKAREVEAQRQAELRKEEERKQSYIRREAESIGKKHRRQLVEEARRRFQQSGVGTLIAELGKLGGYREFYEHFSTDPDLYSSAESYVYEIRIRRTETSARDYDSVTVEEKSIEIETIADGTIKFKGGLFGSTTVSQATWENNRVTLEQALGKAYNHPKIKSYRYTKVPSSHGEGGPCLSGDSLISAPSGFLKIKYLRVGDSVWTIDRFGHRVQAIIVKNTKRIVSKTHTMAHVVLKDGRELFVSPGHPTIDYKMIGSLVKGDKFDGSYVSSIKVIPYKGKYTYDILPYGTTGGYWANGILIGSTLSSQFERTLLDGLSKPLSLVLKFV